VRPEVVTCLWSLKNASPRDQKHVEWVRAFISLLEELRKYTVEYHTTGLSWNPKVPGLPSMKQLA
jgi:hypothetical protein